MADWNSSLYLEFHSERTQPSIDLVQRISERKPKTAIDIGCGPGNSTGVLAEAFPEAKITGVDNSSDMLQTARKTYPNIEFLNIDIASQLSEIPERYDVVFSNACIQWIPNQRKLIPELFGLLNKGGILAIQIPVNFEEPIHRTIIETAKEERWRASFPQLRGMYNLSESEYYDILFSLSNSFDIWKTVYMHRMKSHEAIMEWYRSTGLRPYLDALTGSDKAEFEAEIKAKISEAYPVQAGGEIILRFPRLFFTAIKE